jgi:hypothetical protein
VGASSKKAAQWTISGKQAGKSSKVCFGTPAVADTGNCAFEFKGGASVNAKLKQSVWVPHAGTGTSITLSARVKADNWLGNGRIKATILYLDNSKTNANIVLTEGTYGYTTVTTNKTLKANAIVKKITVEISMKKGTGTQTFTVDNVSLVMNTGGALSLAPASLPDAADNTELRGQ